jgi:glyoxylase-like metal-dependent hydrolase (beta-lactamase superfamily II)
VAGQSPAAQARPAPARQVLAVRYGHRVTSRAESFLNFRLYDEPDAPLDLDYFFWVITGQEGVFLVDTGFAPAAGGRRARAQLTTPAQALPGLGIDPGDVTAIVITHAHWDHIGNVRQFPQAELVMTEAEYAFWTSPLARRQQFAWHSEPDEIELLRARRRDGTLTLFSGQAALAPGIDLIEVGGHTPGQLVAVAARPGPAAGAAVLASDALHFYDEIERDRPFAVLADLPAMYRAYDTLAQLAAQPGTDLVAGHDPAVRRRFAAWPSVTGRAGDGLPDGVQVTDLTRPLRSACGPGGAHSPPGPHGHRAGCPGPVR